MASDREKILAEIKAIQREAFERYGDADYGQGANSALDHLANWIKLKLPAAEEVERWMACDSDGYERCYPDERQANSDAAELDGGEVVKVSIRRLEDKA
jgi:hypothetical protein